MRRWNAHQMVQCVLRELDNRFKNNRGKRRSMNGKRSRTIIDLALNNYLAEQARTMDGEDGIM
jgi:hypothetical protein